MNPLYFLVAVRKALALPKRAHHRCEYCHAPESIFNVVLEVEHITPWLISIISSNSKFNN